MMTLVLAEHLMRHHAQCGILPGPDFTKPAT
jgi:hypothetical protein